MSKKYENMSVLFVDDEENILRSLKRDLHKQPFSSYFADSAEKALEIMKYNSISVIVSDLSMPHTSGLELISIVKNKYPSVVRIILTAIRESDTILNAIEQGNIYRYLIKPWNTRGELIPSLFHAFDYYIEQKEKELRNKELQLQNKALRRANQNLKNAQQAIRDLERKNTALAMGITTNHELNQPLMVISANFELFREYVGEQNLTEKENEILENIQEGFNKINEILKKYREAYDVSFESYLEDEMMVVFKDDSDQIK